MEGDSLLDAIVFLALAGLLLAHSVGRLSRRAEIALNLPLLAALGMRAFGYNLTIGWSFLVEGSIVACVAAFVFALVQYGRRELAEGEYDEPYEAP